MTDDFISNERKKALIDAMITGNGFALVSDSILDKKQALDILLLLSALESWSFSAGQRLPDYLHESLDNAVELLSKYVIGNDA